MTKKKLLRRPPAPKPIQSSKSVLPAVRQPDKGASVHSKFSKNQVLPGQVSSRLLKPHYPLKQPQPDEQLKLNDSLSITTFNNKTTTKEEQLVRERNAQVLNQRIATLNKGKAATIALPPTQQTVCENLQAKKLVDPAGPKPYRSRGPECFPLRPLKSIPELQKGIILKSWNDAVIIPDFKASDRTEEPTHVPRYFSQQVGENVFETLQKPYELTRPRSLCNLPTTTPMEFETRENKDDHPTDTEVADYDPGELLDAISDWKPEKSFDEMFQARRRSLLSNRPHTAHSSRSRDRGSNTGSVCRVQNPNQGEIARVSESYEAMESNESHEEDFSKDSTRAVLNPSSSSVRLASQSAPVYLHQDVSLELQSDEQELLFAQVNDDLQEETKFVNSNPSYAEVMSKKHTPSAMSMKEDEEEEESKKIIVAPTKNTVTTINVSVGLNHIGPRRPQIFEQKMQKELGKRRGSLVGGSNVRKGSLASNVKDDSHQRFTMAKMLDTRKGNMTLGLEVKGKKTGLDDDTEITDISSANMLDLGWLEEKKPRVPKHMIVLSLKKLFKNKVEESGITSPEKLFESGVLEKVLAKVDKIAERHGITGKERIKAVVGATQEYFDQLQEDIKRQNSLEEMRETRRKQEIAMQLTAPQLEVLGSLLEGGEILTLKGHFIYQIPDLSSIRNTLVCLNLSFNNFTTLPDELLLCDQLQFLKLRDNPLTCLPKEIYKLDKLRSLVVSFCKLTDLPPGLFQLRNLEFLDVSYNLLTSLSRDIQFLVALTFLSLEGNELIGLPCTMLSLEAIIRVRIRNNFMSPAFWPETCMPEIPKLSDLCKYTVQRNYVTPEMRQQLSTKVLKSLSSDSLCDCCGRPMYGAGMHVLRHRKEIWGLRQVPFVFQACSSPCHRKFSISGERSVTEID